MFSCERIALASTSVPDRRPCSDAASGLWAVCWRNGPGDGGVECTAAGKLQGGERRCGPGVGPEVRLDVDVLRVCADDSPATPAKQLSKVATDALRRSGHHAGRVASPATPLGGWQGL